MRHTALTTCLLLAATALAGCDALGIETAPQVAAKKMPKPTPLAVAADTRCAASNPVSPAMRDNEILGMPSQTGSTASDPPASAGDEANSHNAKARKS